MKNFIVAILLTFISVGVGISGYMLLEGYDLLSAFYMSVITISTVGFTEVYELSNSGRLFTSFYIIFNLAIFAYVISVFTTYLFEGKLKSILYKIMDYREIKKLDNHIIVCGYGLTGSQVCEELLKENRKFVVIEKDEEKRKGLTDEMNFKMLIGNATSDNVLKLAGIERAKEIIITTPADADNVFITLTARGLNPKILIISRASEEGTEPKLYRAGANHVVLPDHVGGMFMAQMVTKPVVIEFLELLTGRSAHKEKYHLQSFTFQDLKSQYRNKTLKELDIKRLTGATVIAAKDNVKGLIPNPPEDTFIGEDDTMILLCSEANIDKVSSILKRSEA